MELINNISEITECTNCGCCYNICSAKAISVEMSNMFYHPVVNAEKCTNCGLCKQKCPSVNMRPASKPILAYGGWHNDFSVVMNSSSGGAFHGIAEEILKCGGVVYGAAFSDDNKSVVIQSSDFVELEKLQKSKYTESFVGQSFVQIKKELKNNRKVLFCGTPCQVAGLKNYLGDDVENIVTCDFACGGLPSHKVFEEYISSLEAKYKSKVKSVDFRPKTYGWKRYAILIEFQNGKKYNRLGSEDAYLRGFLEGKRTVRDNCLTCRYSNNHFSDITLADFWLHEKLSDLRNDDGISLILCNTEKGKRYIEHIKKNYQLCSLNVAGASYNNVETFVSAESRKRHDVFLKKCKEIGIERACRTTMPVSVNTRLKNFAYRVVQRRRKDK